MTKKVVQFREPILGALLDTASGCMGSEPNNPAWGCASDGCPAGQGPATFQGYALITELEQVFDPLVQTTLCVAYQTNAVAIQNGWAPDNKTCRSSPKWNPQDPINGLPPGDWCAATNSPATTTCHDAFRMFYFQSFSGALVQDQTCPL